ncbi:hypothetical protein LB526_16800 [Mesorhizobium sp. CA6]|uniref:hypothetical protein n=1 Tax=Mesorhizobium sp. CA6 TaxID=588500 RepID=UPI001CCF5B6B|nr:hypothetical protein [Mesorhizobium sp. CA6]MBZ9768416.1 hypothetical protein [Mesorhizobium sp. CA6]
MISSHEIENELFSVEVGFFVKLHQREFNDVAANRALAAVRKIEFGKDHKENYRIIMLIWPISQLFDVAIGYGVSGNIEYYKKLFDEELFKIFGSLSALVE